ncbi:MAG: L,D-transpeptidase [Myxococcales bacterium]|nr:L,D-transpeptidase [Myxococcales bacterium]
MTKAWGAALALCLCVSCSSAHQAAETPSEQQAARGAHGEDSSEAERANTLDLDKQIDPGPITKGSMREHPSGSAWVFDPALEDGPRKLDIAQAEARGYTVVDLGNSWVPYIFTEKTAGAEDSAENDYRPTFIGLANNRINEDGDRLKDHERNYLELYGIPPTIGVILKEWKEATTEVEPCLEAANFDPGVFTRFEGTIAYTKSTTSARKRMRKARWMQTQLDKAMRKQKVAKGDYAAAAEHPKLKQAYENWREYQDEIDVITEAQKRFRCERLFHNGDEGRGKFEAGIYDSATTHALARFEKKHNIMGWGHFKRDNLDMLATGQAESMHRRLMRALDQRVVAAAGILEDGSAAQWKPSFRWKDEAGEEHALRDLAGESLDAAAKALGLDTLEGAQDQLEALARISVENVENVENAEGDGEPKPFDALLVAVKLPPKPAYYSDNMTFDVVIDRGDVWYDFIYDDEGNKLGQPRKRKPRFTLYTTYNEQRIPLVRWGTTIGSWRNELKDGKVYYKYKNSDVGPRVWKDIVSAPTWIPPASTPAPELLRRSWKDGKFGVRVNYETMGPSYKSAYGLVAAYHIKEVFDDDGNLKAELDNGIRTHGSVDYMSILRRYSHGCHRLYNMNAVRLFSFVLRHREYTREGQIPLGFGRNIEHEGKTYNIRLASRGYKFRLNEPIPVMVTKGNIQGKRKTPHENFIEKPGVDYAEAPVCPEGVVCETGQTGEAGEDPLTPGAPGTPTPGTPTPTTPPAQPVIPPSFGG